MISFKRRLLWVAAYALAMALLEAVVVVYLRGLIAIGRDQVSLGPYMDYEVWREAGTLVMLVVVGALTSRHWRERLAYTLFAFGLWDMGYYAWLRVFIGWPGSLLDWDILFLIPFRWWGPVLAPVLIAALLALGAVLALRRLEGGERLAFSPPAVASAGLGALLALYTFMADSLQAWLQQQPDWYLLRPAPFRWPLFLLALALMAVPILTWMWPALRSISLPPGSLRAVGGGNE
jgi:hypothetical protein